MKLPNQKAIEALYAQYHTPQHIQDHMQVVATLAIQIGQAIERVTPSRNQVSVPLLKAAALVHDLVRIQEQWQYLPDTIKTPQTHAEINYLILKNEYPEVATTVRAHSLMTVLKTDAFETLEQKIIFYADKRVNHSTVVSLPERLQLGQQRWGVTAENDQSAELLVHLSKLEQHIFESLTISPEDLHA